MIDRPEAEAIASYLGIDVGALIEDYADPYPLRENSCILRQDEWGCVFLGHEGRTAACTIYDVRPAACRAWQPSLRRPECLDGLRRLAPDGVLLQPEALFRGESDLAAFVSRLT